jgi:G3E family GTPase
LANSRIPVLVITGFLGSGKTTLLNHLLASAAGTRIGVVVNDFGSINIDAMAVAGQVDSMVSLGNGCLCCAVDGSDLDEMLAKLAEPSAKIDVIVVEASGLAEPQNIVRMLLFSDNGNIRYGGLVEVVDAAEFEATRSAHPELDRHLAFADLVVLNKIDRVESPSDVLAVINSLAPGKPVQPVVHGAVDPGLLFDRSVAPPDAARQLSFDDLADHSQHAHALYSSVEFTAERPLHPRRLMSFLDSRPSGLYRMKGFVCFGPDSARYDLHTVGSYLRFHPASRARDRGAQLVMIGTDLDADTIIARLRECELADGEEVSEDEMLYVLRHTDTVLPDDPADEITED